MNCKDVEKILPAFVRHECSEKEEAIILEHVRSCKECREELTIQLLLAEGLNRLESGDSFDLNVELEKRLKGKEQEKKPRKKRKVNHEMHAIIADIITGAIIVAVIVGLLIWQIH